MTAGEMRFPHGIIVHGAAVADRHVNADWRGSGLYLAARWARTWPASLPRTPLGGSGTGTTTGPWRDLGRRPG